MTSAEVRGPHDVLVMFFKLRHPWRMDTPSDERALPTLWVPLIATTICAGFPSPADDWLDDQIDLGRLLRPRQAPTFAWRVEGESMVGAGIGDRDLVIVDRSLDPRDGDVVVAIVEGALSLKTLRLGPDGPRLECANPEFPPFLLGEDADAVIWGVVTWVLHNFRGER